MTECPVLVQNCDDIGRLLNKGPEKFLVLPGLFLDCFVFGDIPDGYCIQDDLALEVDNRVN
jgi:hypothetical protein